MTKIEKNVMWMSFEIDGGKDLSQVEMLTLCAISEYEFIPAPEIMNNIGKIMTGFWVPQRGSIYPILHRLAQRGLLNQNKNETKLAFQRSELGSIFVASASGGLVNQLRSNLIFTGQVLTEIIKLDPFNSLDVIKQMTTDIQDFSNRIEYLRKQAEENDKKEGWKDIQFE